MAKSPLKLAVQNQTVYKVEVWQRSSAFLLGPAMPCLLACVPKAMMQSVRYIEAALSYAVLDAAALSPGSSVQSMVTAKVRQAEVDAVVE